MFSPTVQAAGVVEHGAGDGEQWRGLEEGRKSREEPSAGGEF